jgi:hypothetical protein
MWGLDDTSKMSYTEARDLVLTLDQQENIQADSTGE